MDLRVRMVLLGLVLGVIVAVIVAAQGCSTTGTGKRTFHGSGGAGPPVAAVDVAGAAGNAPGSQAAAPRARRASARIRRADPQGVFFGYAHGRMSRRDPPRGRRLVALTFDDGPGPQTAQILAELRRLHARATFFVVGMMASIRPGVVREERRLGMEIDNHTWSHPPMPQLSPVQQRLQIVQTDQIIHKLTGQTPRFFRPPMWMVGATTARLVRRAGLIGVMRTVDTRDWTLPGVRAIVRSALRVRPGGVVAMHDAGGYTRTETLEAVPAIVRGLRRRHLRLVTISQLYDGRV